MGKGRKKGGAFFNKAQQKEPGSGVLKSLPKGHKDDAKKDILNLVKIPGGAQISLNVGELPAPEVEFSGNAVCVQYLPLYGSVNIFFVGGDPVFKEIHTVVRVRFPAGQFVEAIQQTESNRLFFEELEQRFSGRSLEGLWVPQLETLSPKAVGSDSFIALEGNMAYMAHHGDSATCDIFRVAPTTIHRLVQGKGSFGQIDVESQLRVNLPTVLIYMMIKEIRGISLEEGSK